MELTESNPVPKNFDNAIFEKMKTKEQASNLDLIRISVRK